MQKETLQNLIEVHNTLYSFPVAGAMVIPMAQVLATLQNIISAENKGASGTGDVPECDCDGTEVFQ